MTAIRQTILLEEMRESESLLKKGIEFFKHKPQTCPQQPLKEKVFHDSPKGAKTYFEQVDGSTKSDQTQPDHGQNTQSGNQGDYSHAVNRPGNSTNEGQTQISHEDSNTTHGLELDTGHNQNRNESSRNQGSNAVGRHPPGIGPTHRHHVPVGAIEIAVRGDRQTASGPDEDSDAEVNDIVHSRQLVTGRPTMAVSPMLRGASPGRDTPLASQPTPTGRPTENCQSRNTENGIKKAQNIQDVPLDDCLPENSGLRDTLARMLDKEHKVINNWHHLAYYFKVPSEVSSGFEMHSERSPTEHLFSFLRHWNPDMTIKDLKDKLKSLYRNDIIQRLNERRYPDTYKVAEVVFGPGNLLELLTEKLDTDSKVVGNWKSLAVKCQVPRSSIDKLGVAEESPTGELFTHVRASERFSRFNIKELKGLLGNMERRDVVRVIDKYGYDDVSLVNKVFVPNSDILDEVCERLDKDMRVLKGWKHLAYRLEISNTVYDTFDGSKAKARSPTKSLLAWLKLSRPEITVGDLLQALKKIDRYDAFEVLEAGAGKVLTKMKTEKSINSTPANSQEHRNAEQIHVATGPVGPTGPYQQAPRQNGSSVPHSVPQRQQRPLSGDNKLQMKISDLPLYLKGSICPMLNAQREFFDDYRMLAESFGMDHARIKALERVTNPTYEILMSYSQGATVEELLRILLKEDFSRRDVVAKIQEWIDNGSH